MRKQRGTRLVPKSGRLGPGLGCAAPRVEKETACCLTRKHEHTHRYMHAHAHTLSALGPSEKANSPQSLLRTHSESVLAQGHRDVIRDLWDVTWDGVPFLART